MWKHLFDNWLNNIQQMDGQLPGEVGAMQSFWREYVVRALKQCPVISDQSL